MSAPERIWLTPVQHGHPGSAAGDGETAWAVGGAGPERTLMAGVDGPDIEYIRADLHAEVANSLEMTNNEAQEVLACSLSAHAEVDRLRAGLAQAILQIERLGGDALAHRAVIDRMAEVPEHGSASRR